MKKLLQYIYIYIARMYTVATYVHRHGPAPPNNLTWPSTSLQRPFIPYSLPFWDQSHIYKWSWFDPNSLLWPVLLLCDNLCNDLIFFSGNLYASTCCANNFMCKTTFVLCQLYLYEYMLDFVYSNLNFICVATHVYNKLYFVITFFYNNL